MYAVYFFSFAFNMWIQYKQFWYWNDSYKGWQGSGYYFGEKVYQVLSLVSKSTLLWLVVSGSF